MTKSPHEIAVESAARACHEALRAYSLALGDTSHLPWDESTEEMRRLCRQGVEGVVRGDGPSSSHEKWRQGKQAAGWVYGTEKDEGRKTHPCLVPYDDLPLMQQRKDQIFVSVAWSVFMGVFAELSPLRERR